MLWGVALALLGLWPGLAGARAVRDAPLGLILLAVSLAVFAMGTVLAWRKGGTAPQAAPAQPAAQQE